MNRQKVIYMKINKILLIALAITTLTSVSNIFEFSQFTSFKSISGSIPAFNGSKSWTKHLTLQEGGYEGQALASVSISPSSDTLDVILYRTSPGATINGGWKIISNRQDPALAWTTNWGFPPDADYKLTIDSRWYYTNSTSVSGQWGFYNN